MFFAENKTKEVFCSQNTVLYGFFSNIDLHEISCSSGFALEFHEIS
jgi:hypothetical protein